MRRVPNLRLLPTVEELKRIVNDVDNHDLIVGTFMSLRAGVINDRHGVGIEHFNFDMVCVCSYAFMCGYVVGVRNERKRRKGKV